MDSQLIEDSYEIRKLTKEDTVEVFDCGDDDLNDFILNESRPYRQAMLAVSHVLRNKNTKQVIAYFSLANDRISLSDFPTNSQFNRFRKGRFPHEKRLKSYPAAKICRLAVSLAGREMHLGTFLLDFIKTYFVMDNKTGCRFLTVDAYAQAVPFYIKNGFVPLSNEDAEATTRLLYFDLADVAD